jgi:hypothetical protein
MRPFNRFLHLILFLATVVLAGGCIGITQSEQLPEPLPHALKGYELYSWQAPDGNWQYTLVTGSNRLKSAEELTTGDDTETSDGWVKLTATGLDALLDLLERLPAGEQIFWHDASSPAPTGAEPGLFRLPEERVVAEVEQQCRALDLQLTVRATENADDASTRESLPEPALEAVLELPESLTGGETVPLTFTLINHERDPLYVLKWYTPLEGVAGKIFRVTHNGQGLPYQGILAMRGDPGPENYVLLPPGEPVTATVDLAQDYDFSEPGTYTVTFLSPRISHVALTEADMAQTVDELGPVTIASEPITVTVGTGE